MNKLGDVRTINEMRGKTKRQRTIALIQDMARRRDKRLALLPFPNKPGIYSVVRTSKEKIGNKTKFRYRLRQIYDLSRRSLKLRASPWMAPVNKGIFKNQGRIAEAAFNRFIKTIK